MVDEEFKAAVNSTNHVNAVQVPLISGTMQKQPLSGPSNMVIRRNGYLYVYLSNEANQFVYFDDLVINHKRGPLTEQKDYYAFGLEIPGLSTQAFKPNYNANRSKYNGKEIQNKEFLDGSGLENYDYGARMYDPQIGRFNTEDRLADKYFNLSPYEYTADNPIRYIDANGDSIVDKDNIVADLKSYLNTSITTLNTALKDGTLPQGISADDVTTLVNEYQATLGEIGTLEKSDQIYNVSYNASKGEGGTSYNNESGQIDIGVAKGSTSLQSVGLAAHELKHGYQYETKQTSFSWDGKHLEYYMIDQMKKPRITGRRILNMVLYFVGFYWMIKEY